MIHSTYKNIFGLTCTLYLVLLLAFISSTTAKLPDYVKNLVDLDNNNHLEDVLSKVLIPRVVGSQGHEAVGSYIIGQLEEYGLRVEIDEFIEYTPTFGNLTFKNIIGKFNPSAKEFIALACHYDSKYFPNNPNFVGAIDSGVPVAILLNLAKVLLPSLESVKEKTNIGIMFIFFDGEEAFLEWNQQDSLYGARNLAKKMAKITKSVAGSNEIIRDIDRIEVLVLLDLVGAVNSKFKNFYFNTESLHGGLVQIERDLRKENLLENRNNMFLPEYAHGLIDDDHRPFLEKDVPVLHLIATPFPPQWHKNTDTATNLHWPSIRNFNRILRVFIYEFVTKHTENVDFRVIHKYGK